MGTSSKVNVFALPWNSDFWSAKYGWSWRNRFNFFFMTNFPFEFPSISLFFSFEEKQKKFSNFTHCYAPSRFHNNIVCCFSFHSIHNFPLSLTSTQRTATSVDGRRHRGKVGWDRERRRKRMENSAIDFLNVIFFSSHRTTFQGLSRTHTRSTMGRFLFSFLGWGFFFCCSAKRYQELEQSDGCARPL